MSNNRGNTWRGGLPSWIRKASDIFRLGGWRRRSRNAGNASHSNDGGRLDDEASLTTPLLGNGGRRKSPSPNLKPIFKADEGSEKLGTFSGVFVPTTLNVLSILMFLRFGFILGQSGLLGMLALLVIAYLINLVTTLSISAIASNGTVRGGGAYYLISRSLGAEFGGSIGLVFYLGFVFNTGMNSVALIDCLFENFGLTSGDWYNVLPQDLGFRYLWTTCVLVLCTAVCLAGSSLFTKCSNALLVILLIATFSIPFSALFLSPFSNSKQHIQFTGLSLRTLMENLTPHFTKHAAGSQIDTKENYPDLFGILFPATGGIFAGASMSADLKNPSKSIPRGTLAALGVTFGLYTIVVLSMAASITRASLYSNVNVIQDTNVSEILVFLGEIATCLFSVLMGIIGPAKLLQAIARDDLLPGLKFFSQGTKAKDEPIYAIILTFAISQVTILFDLNRLASLVAMTYLMTFLATNLACFLLTVASAPNFRPSFRYFNRWTAAVGTLVSGASMFFIDGLYAGGCICILVVLFALIHFTAVPRSWGDVSQALIFHQVRKYLLRLRQEHVKSWRPQILLLLNDPRRGYKLIQFCNSLKKGGLYILGHIIVSSDFGNAVPEARRQQTAWMKLIDLSRIKAFVNINISPSVEWGARNLVSAGLGGMRPNIVVLGFYNLDAYRTTQSIPELAKASPETWDLEAINQEQQASTKKRRRRRSKADAAKPGPTESYRSEGLQDIQSYITVLEDLLLNLRMNVAVAKGFRTLELPYQTSEERNTKKFIDLWPIQMSAEISEGDQSVLTTNFDTYTLVLQLGCILATVPSYKRAYTLRVLVFVEYENEIESEKARVTTLLETLRIEADVVVLWLASGNIKSYETIVNGIDGGDSKVEKVLGDQDWWTEVQKYRGTISDPNARLADGISQAEDLLNNAPSWPISSFQQGRRDDAPRFNGLRRLELARPRARMMRITTIPKLWDIPKPYPVHHELRMAAAGEAREQVSRGNAPEGMLLIEEEDIDLENQRYEDFSEGLDLHTRPVKIGQSDGDEDAPGPSIMFSNVPTPPRAEVSQSNHAQQSIYQRKVSGQSSRASGFPSAASLPLSFNDLPCRAQHLILNELMLQQSKDTAVLFSTLPAPLEGTSRSEADCLSYLTDLEVLTENLPPTLLVHSNSDDKPMMII
ncbi:putative cation chloride cotransporter [Phaeomoniella chlamydospora]|uniref:Putative cation chloride cotransporter n=1 Tax=Phaeomoniella chlamydospora TaxID=158046 RepID=A0A0G2F2M1_PHACM|nr:putative cation chloride cotransporter [Phaeomoniella chlamydospora]